MRKTNPICNVLKAIRLENYSMIYLLLTFFMSIASSAYGQNCLRDTLVRHFKENNVKEISFVMYNFTRDRIHRYGYVNLEGKINAKSIKLHLIELKTNDTNLKWTKHPFKTSPLLEDSLISLLDSQFVSNRIPFILKKEVLDLTRYEDLNCLSVWIKRKGKNEKHDFFFGDYSQTQVVSDTMITYSPQMIELFKLLETIIRNERENNKANK